MELELLPVLRGKKQALWEQLLLSSGLTPEEVESKKKAVEATVAAAGLTSSAEDIN